MEYGITFLAFILLYALFSFFNPIARTAIQHTALLKYTDRGTTKYKLVFSKKRVLKELIYEKNLNHIDIPFKVDLIFFFDRHYLLKSFDGHHVRNARDEMKLDIIENMNVSFLNVYEKYSVKRFTSFVRGDYENDSYE